MSNIGDSPPPSDDEDFPPPEEDFDDDFDDDFEGNLDGDLDPPPDDDEDVPEISDDDPPEEDEDFPPPDDDEEGPPDNEDIEFGEGFSPDEDSMNDEPPGGSDDDPPPIDDGVPSFDGFDNEEFPIDAEGSLPSSSVHNSKRSSSTDVHIDNSYVLPVSPPSMPSKPPLTVSDELEDYPINLNLDSLTIGLSIKDPPKILKKSVKIVDQQSMGGGEINTSDDLMILSTDQQVMVDEHSFTASVTDSAPHIMKTSSVSLTADIQHSFEEKDFVFGLGKYEGDPFEPMYLKAHKSRKQLEIALETGENMLFDLSHKAYIFEDTVDTNTIVLDYHRNVIVFKFSSSDQLISFMKNMPEEVFFAPDALQDEESTDEEEEHLNVKESVLKKPISKPAPPKSAPPPGSGPKIEHVKGTSVEDILENDFETTSERQEKIEQMFQVKEIVPVVPHPPRHRELIDTYIRKPKYSVRRVTLLCEWINSMHIWPNRLTITSLHKEMCNGLLLAKLVKKLNPEVQFVNLNEKPLAKKAALENLEQALGHIWRSKSLNNSRIPSANDIYSGNTSKTAVLLNELYGVYVLKPLYKNAIKMLKWYHYVLKQYQRPLPNYIFEDGDLSGVWPHFQSGNLSTAQRVDPLRMVGDPTSICDFRDNLTYVFQLLRLLGIDILWTAEDWISNPDTEFILLQLQYIYDILRFKQCTLPPAQGDKPGLTSGPNGEALVVGLIFSDAPSSLKFIPKTQKAVRLGHDKDSMPLLPVDRMIKNPRFVSHGVLPLGMLSSHNVKIVEVTAEFSNVPSLEERGDWNSRTTVRTDKENYVGHHLVSILREHHKQGDTFSPSRSVKQNGVEVKRDLDVSNHILSVTNIDMDNNGFKSHDQVSKEIKEMVRSLEDEMKRAQEKISCYEDSLAAKYGELEANIDETPLDVYESKLLSLEDERIQLEQEKQNLQDYFARKLALIRARKDEIQQLHFAKQQAAFSTLLLASNTSGPNNKQRDILPKTMKGGAELTQKHIIAAEKGWIKLSARMETHNFHLRSKQAIACAAFQAKITPKSLRVRSGHDASQRHGEGTTFALEPSDIHYSKPKSTSFLGDSGTKSPDIVIQDSFSRFKYRLKCASDKWLQSKMPKDRQSLADAIANTKVPQVELISIPSKFDGGEHPLMEEVKHEHVFNFSSSVRQEELQVMFYEDERRRMVIAEEAFEKSVQLSQHLFQFEGNRHEESDINLMGNNHDPLINDLQIALQKFKDAPPSVDDVERALQYLAVDRLIIVNERSPKEYIFSLVGTLDHGESKYAIEWKDVPIYSNEETSIGILLLEDILDLDIHITDVLVLMLYIKELPRAVKNSKGRTLLNLRFPSNQDCLEYCLHLSCLRSIT